MAYFMNWFVTGEIKALVVALLGLGVYALASRRSAATRHALVTLTLLCCLAVPFTTPGNPSTEVRPIVPLSLNLVSRMVPPPVLQPTMKGENQSPRTLLPQVMSRLILGRNAIFGMAVGAYALFSLLLFVRFVLGSLLTCRIRGSARPYRGQAVDADFPVLLSDRVTTPVAIGVLSRVIALPVSAASWSPERLQAAMLHEEEHLRRRDPLWLGVAHVVRAFLWINPAIWLLGRLQVRDAEQSTDDRVLSQGIQAEEYAQVLIDVAKESRKAPTLAVAMVRKSGLNCRVRAILSKRVKRGSADLVALVLVVGLFGGLGTLGHGYGVRLMTKIVGGGAIDQGPAQQPGTLELTERAGQAKNNFTTACEDGRAVQLVQVQRWTPQGVEAWRPDGLPIPRAERIPDEFGRRDPAELHFFTKIKSALKPDDINGGLGSSPINESGGAQMEEFMGGYCQGVNPADPDTRIIVSFIRIPNLGTSGYESYRFGMADKNWIPLARTAVSNSPVEPVQAPASLRTYLGSEFESSIKIGPDIAEPFVRDAKGNAIPDGHGGDKQEKVPATSIKYTTSSGAVGMLEMVPHAFDLSGKPLKTIWNDTSQKGDKQTWRWCWKEPVSKIGYIQIDSRTAIHADFYEVRVRPNRDSSNP